MTNRRGASLEPELDEELEGGAPGDSPWPRLAAPPSGRSPSPRLLRRAARWAAALAAVAFLGYGIHWLGTSTASWLQDQAEYQVPFDASVLDPGPPAYLTGGASVLLERMRHAARLPERVSTLRADLAGLARALALASPWVERVESIRIPARAQPLVIGLRYRRPVAWIADRAIILDAHGVVLPNRELDPENLPPLLCVRGYAGDTSVPRPGAALASADGPDQRALLAGLRLVDFVLHQSNDGRIGGTKLASVDIANGAEWLSLQTHDGYRISWGEAPGLESPGRAKALEKWRTLAELLAQSPLTPRERQSRFISVVGGKAEVRSDEDLPNGRNHRN